MPTIELVKLKIRRGSELQRQRVVLEQGELALATDTKRVFVGDGILSGGNVIGNMVHAPAATTGSRVSIYNAQRGDLVYENSLMYQLTGTDYSQLSSWGYVGTKSDNTTIEYDSNNKLRVKPGSITMDMLSAGAIPSYDNVTIGLSSGALYVKNDSIHEYKIPSSALSNGLLGGSGSKIRLNVGQYFAFSSGVLTLTAAPMGTLAFSNIPPALIGPGLTLNGGTQTLDANIQAVDGSTVLNTAGTIGLNNFTSTNTQSFAKITKDSYGRVTSNTSSIATTFALSAKPGSATNYGVISAFNGYPGQTVQGRLTDVELTTFSIISSNGTSSVNLTLSSAGFITLEQTSAQDNSTVGRFAIPVFSY